MNLYQYVVNNSINLTDPSGLQLVQTGAGVSAIILYRLVYYLVWQQYVRAQYIYLMGFIAEQLVLAKKNTEKIQVAGRCRIPDGWDDILKIITEVKNVARPVLTQQIKDFVTWAEATPGYRFVLYIRQYVKPSKPLQRLIDQGRMELKRLPEVFNGKKQTQ